MSTGALCPAPPSFRPRLWKCRAASGAAAAFAIAAFWAAPPPLASAQSGGDASATARQHAIDLSTIFKTIARDVGPAVVSIRSTRRVERARLGGGSQFQFSGDERMREFMERFFGDRFNSGGEDDPGGGFSLEYGLGSGFIVDTAGYIVTNNHVIEGAHEIWVTLGDRRRFQAELIGGDAPTDLAVLKIEGADGLRAAALGDSDAMEVGDWVVAIGNPMGLDHSISQGIVSGMGRYFNPDKYEYFIQTTAAINLGNSGGPLVNLEGEVIGVNTQIGTTTGGWMGVGFALPSNMVRSIMDQLIETGEIRRGYLGLFMQDMSAGLAATFNLDRPTGVVVTEIVAGGPSEKAGVEVDDVLLTYNGREIMSGEQLSSLVAMTPPESEVAIEVLRDGERRTLRVTLAVRDETETRTGSGEPRRLEREPGTAFGMTVSELNAASAGQLGLDESTRGVLVTAVEESSPAWRAGVRGGDVITNIGRDAIETVGDFERAMDDGNAARAVRLRIIREGAARMVALVIR